MRSEKRNSDLARVAIPDFFFARATLKEEERFDAQKTYLYTLLLLDSLGAFHFLRLRNLRWVSPYYISVGLRCRTQRHLSLKFSLICLGFSLDFIFPFFCWSQFLFSIVGLESVGKEKSIN